MPVTHIRLKCVPVRVRVHVAHGLATVAETAPEDERTRKE